TGESFRQAEVWALATDGHGDIWLGTSTRGVLQWDGRRLSAPDVAGLPARDPVWSLARDSRGRMWAGTSDGLSRFTRSPFDVRVAGLGTRTTWSVRLDGSGTPWASTDDGEVWRWQGDRWLPAIPLQRDRPAVSLWPLRDGRMLMVDDEGRAFTGLSGTSRVTPFPSLGSGGLVYSVFEDVDRSLLVVTDGAIIRHEGGRSTDVTARFGLDRKSLPDVIWRDSRHRLLFGRPYLTIVDGSTIRRVAAREGLTDPQVTALYEEGEHLWIGTADSGLYVLRGNAVTHLTPRNARLRRHITGIAGDGEGALWITTRSGLLRVATREAERAIGDSTVPLAVRLFDRADGLPAMEFFGDYQSQLAMDSSGALWLPSYGGPIRFDPSAIRDDSIPPQVQIERTVVDGVMLPEGDTIRLPRHPIRVDITFAATNANIPQRVRASYRVIGLDSNWTDVGLRRFITFGPLRGGQYQVEIRAAGDGGPWSPVTGRVTIDVALAWYEQRWFYPLLIGTIILIVTVVVRRRVAGAERRALALEAVVAERTAELAQSRDFLEHRVAERTSQLASELEERSRLEQRLSAARKLESLGRLAGGVAHEINNALTSVLGFAQLAEHAAAGNEAVEDDLREVVRAGRRAADITHQLLAFAKRQHTELAPVRLDQVVRNLTRAIEQLVEPPMSVTVEIADDLPPIMADSSQIEQLLINLVKNARDASPADGRIEVQLSLQQWDEPRAVRDQLLPAGAYLRLTVTDQGTGIAPEIRDQLFDPFFTTKEHHAGTGLGLSVCQGIAARHHGAIDVESNAGGPTAFHCDLPVPATVPSLVVNTVESPFGAETILLVDDEAAVRKVAARVLTSYGYRVLDAGDGEEALAVFRNSADDIDAVVTDVIMPRMSGLELARQLRRLRPSVPIVFFSGFIGHDELALAELDELGPLLPKPFAPDALAQTLRTTLGATRPG
ncbi:MAG: hypothetical protein RLZZ621_2174, partial [Gemmatimonadota bacterium]